MLKGHYTFSRSMALRADYELPTPEAQDAQLGARQRRPAAHVTDGVRLSAALAQRKQQRRHRANADQRLADQRHLRRFSGSPFTVTADGTDVEYAGQHCRQPISSGPVTKIGEIGADGFYYRSGRVGAARRRSLREHAGRTSSAARAAGTSTSRCSARSRLTGDAPHRGARRSVQRHQHAEVRQPDEQHHERRFHAHLRPVRLVCGTAGPAGGSVQLLSERDVPGHGTGTSRPFGSDMTMVVGQHERARARPAATTAPDAPPPAPPSAAAGIKTRILVDRRLTRLRDVPDARRSDAPHERAPGVPGQSVLGVRRLQHDARPVAGLLAARFDSARVLVPGRRGDGILDCQPHQPRRELEPDAAARDVAQRRAHLPRDLPAVAEQRPRHTGRSRTRSRRSASAIPSSFFWPSPRCACR